MAGIVDPSTPTRVHESVVDRTGQLGVTVVTDTSAVTGPFYCLQCLEDTIFATFVETGATGGSMVGFAVPAGTPLYGNITSFSLTSGKVRAYKG